MIGKNYELIRISAPEFMGTLGENHEYSWKLMIRETNLLLDGGNGEVLLQARGLQPQAPRGTFRRPWYLPKNRGSSRRSTGNNLEAGSDVFGVNTNNPFSCAKPIVKFIKAEGWIYSVLQDDRLRQRWEMRSAPIKSPADTDNAAHNLTMGPDRKAS